MAPTTNRWIWIGTVLCAALLALPAAVETVRRDRVKAAYPRHIRVVPPLEVARMIAGGRKVVFVDVREPEEFREFHIPGAISAPVRDLGDLDLARLEGADLVIPYCLKDFRGFEGAKALRGRGVANLALLAGFGIKSWKKSGLPVAGEVSGLTDAKAGEQLLARAREKRS